MLIQLYPFNSLLLVYLNPIFSHFVRRDTSHLSETVSCFFGQYDYITITFFTKYFLFKKIS